MSEALIETHGVLHGSLIERHHKVHRDPKDDTEVHVFVIAGPPPFGSKDARWDFDVQIPLGPVTFGLRGYIDLGSLTINATLYVLVPLFGSFTLATVNGNLNDGVSVTFGLSGILSGTARVYINGDTLYIALTATIFGSNYGPLTIPIIHLPL